MLPVAGSHKPHWHGLWLPVAVRLGGGEAPGSRRRRDAQRTVGTHLRAGLPRIACGPNPFRRTPSGRPLAARGPEHRHRACRPMAPRPGRGTHAAATERPFSSSRKAPLMRRTRSGSGRNVLEPASEDHGICIPGERRLGSGAGAPISRMRQTGRISDSGWTMASGGQACEDRFRMGPALRSCDRDLADGGARRCCSPAQPYRE